MATVALWLIQYVIVIVNYVIILFIYSEYSLFVTGKLNSCSDVTDTQYTNA